MEIKTKVNKWDLIKLKNLCTAKQSISKVKRQPSEWKKIIANETTDRGLISKLYKQLMQLNVFLFKVFFFFSPKQYVTWTCFVVVVVAVFCYYYKLSFSMSTFRPLIFKVVIDVVGLL